MTSRHDPVAVVQHTELITAPPADALAGLLNIDPPLRESEEIPPLWHWVYLLERPAQGTLGADGHPTSGIPEPPGPNRRRMFAGGRVTTHRALRPGEAATRTVQVLRTAEKRGTSGLLTFVTVGVQITQGGRLAISEEQDIVYRSGADPLPTRSPPTTSRSREAVVGGVPSLEFDVDETVLFRFSALTYNAHRIHYDRKYATEEGYPDLVVHGPLQALLMGEAMRRRGHFATGAQFTYRLVAPAFGKQRLRAEVQPGAYGFESHMSDGAGEITARSELTRAPAGGRSD